MRRRAPTLGQAVIETAFVLPLLLFLIGGFIGLMLRVQAQNELDSATALAVASSFQGGSQSDEAYCDAQDSFRGTMSFYSKYSSFNSHPPNFDTTCVYPVGSSGAWVDCFGDYFAVNWASPRDPADVGLQPDPGSNVRCVAHMKLLMSKTPVAFAWFGDPDLTSTVEGTAPAFRQ